MEFVFVVLLAWFFLVTLVIIPFTIIYTRLGRNLKWALWLYFPVIGMFVTFVILVSERKRFGINGWFYVPALPFLGIFAWIVALMDWSPENKKVHFKKFSELKADCETCPVDKSLIEENKGALLEAKQVVEKNNLYPTNDWSKSSGAIVAFFVIMTLIASLFTGWFFGFILTVITFAMIGVVADSINKGNRKRHQEKLLFGINKELKLHEKVDWSKDAQVLDDCERLSSRDERLKKYFSKIDKDQFYYGYLSSAKEIESAVLREKEALQSKQNLIETKKKEVLLNEKNAEERERKLNNIFS
ncbi:hypothetical protein [Thiomicrospira cyclica]|uniref:Uncharacterized protein n=1 Tax=Thiomicrospira cyclica (strain DSM 14477 / JCM 11371 / ALM1) TaxID=717773 RepID=F6DAJ8_THICA|nr:hypothetical protein [Thiomicrospira cyclica]AEG32254.1 hypothetical protein Thicy_1494 [Thiomicrospira cyclica ALM1]